MIKNSKVLTYLNLRVSIINDCTFALPEMTTPKHKGRCPICGKTLQLVTKHLRAVHCVQNKKECAILNNMAMGRTPLGSGTCPVVTCGKNVHVLDQHIWDHEDLSVAEKEKFVTLAKREEGLAQLFLLRVSDPSPPMVSRLDIDRAEDSDVDDDVSSSSGECLDSRCMDTRKRLARLKVNTVSVTMIDQRNVTVLSGL